MATRSDVNNNSGTNNTRKRGRPRGRGKGRGGQPRLSHSTHSPSNYTLFDLRDKKKRSLSLSPQPEKEAQVSVTESASPLKKPVRPAKSIQMQEGSSHDSEDLTPQSSDFTPVESSGQSVTTDQLSPGNAEASSLSSKPSASPLTEPTDPPPPPEPPATSNTDFLLQQMLNRLDGVESKLGKLDSVDNKLNKLDVIESKTNSLGGQVQGIQDSVGASVRRLGF